MSRSPVGALFHLSLAHFVLIPALVPLYRLGGALLQRAGQLLASGVFMGIR